MPAPHNIVVCLEGTTNEVAGDSTNVLRLYRCLVRDEMQICYYDAGVGTVADSSAITAEGKRLSKRFDSATGRTVRENAIKAYRFLISRYRPGDKIYLFGFSRGAYTAKALAGMIQFLGLAQPELENLAPLAWAVFSDDDSSLKLKNRFQGGARFKKSFAVEAETKIHFAGLWDSVSSFGAFWNFKTLPFTSNNPAIDHIRHALAIDERRAFFKANLFRPKDGTQHGSFKQVWFAGVHCDVGGGNAEKDDSLAKVAFQWMLMEAIDKELRIFKPAADEILQGKTKNRSHPDPLGKLNESLKGTWQLAEVVPYRSYNHDADAVRWNPPNFGGRRVIAEGSVIHEAVVDRLKNAQPRYCPANLPKIYSVEPLRPWN
jgi:uncharacterized protein (DUF2235 family)